VSNNFNKCELVTIIFGTKNLLKSLQTLCTYLKKEPRDPVYVTYLMYDLLSALLGDTGRHRLGTVSSTTAFTDHDWDNLLR